MWSKIYDCLEWATVEGANSLALDDLGERVVTVDLISEGASLFLLRGDPVDQARLLLWCGVGSGRVQVRVQNGDVLAVDQPEGQATAIRVPEARSMRAEWRRTASYTDLEPKRPHQVSDEVRAVMNEMNANAIRREMMLLAALRRRQDAV